ncbi:MAG: CDP-diacylglycerol--glycerol-3-phosphate 3-phosphatidyltransferase [Xanthomonadaceae bacterium]|nr:CDP-diacylglycerol--glycerol-3-phosphate 3-phosphatidyltransferase [Xanthomonadaceae bacterium]
MPYNDDELKFDTVPNRLTAIRIAIVPVVVILLYMRTYTTDIIAGFTFAAAAITDYFDGKIARETKTITIYGKLMDPLADKFLVICSLIMLQWLERVHPFFVMVLICRELAITSLRALASAEGVIIAASPGGKWKNLTQMFAIPFMMAKPGLLGIPLFAIGEVLLYLSLGMSLWSGLQYIMGFFAGVTVRAKERRSLRKQHSKNEQ